MHGAISPDATDGIALAAFKLFHDFASVARVLGEENTSLDCMVTQKGLCLCR